MELASVKSQFGDPARVVTQSGAADPRNSPAPTAEPLPLPQSNGLFLILVRMREMTYLLSYGSGSAPS